ncbi:MAG TPA: MBL fold metallo-hydrolase [Desulfitobacteriaceae bacterium]|nr:MBL fold metallo-hydrolase [Desulfitobacteriaceae bacterium]
MRKLDKFCSLVIIFLLVHVLVGCSSDPGIPVASQPPAAATDSQTTPAASIPIESTTITSKQKLKISYIDVGQADSTLIQIPNGRNVLIDAGNNDDSDKIVTYLKEQGINKLDIVIGTHPHEDHIGALDTVIKTFTIGQIIMPPKDSTTNTYRDVIEAIAGKGQKIVKAQSGLNLDLGSEVSAQLLAPNSSDYEEINNYSAVLKITYGKTSFLFEGDAQSLSELEMVKAGYDLKADVLRVGHHGSQTSCSDIFLAKVQPKYAVISVGRENSYGHPSQATLDKLYQYGVKVYRTDQSGTIISESDGTNISIYTADSKTKP